MQSWTRSLVGLLLGGGATLTAYVLLSPAVWTRDDLSSFQIGAALAAAGCFRVARAGTDRTTVHGVPAWLVHTAGMAVCLAAAYVVLFAMGGLIFGEHTLGSSDQVATFVVACAVVIGFFIGTSRRWGFGRRAREVEHEGRIASIRAQARRDIDKLVADARDSATPHDPEDGTRSMM